MPPPTHPTATLADIRSLAVRYIPKADPDIMAAIAMAESGGKYRVVGTNSNGSTDKGLWQINSIHSLESKGYDLFDPEDNAKAAAIVYDKQGYDAWTVYKTGAYKKFIGDNVYAPGLGPTGLDSGVGVTDVVKQSINAVNETMTRIGLNSAAVTIAVVLLIMGFIILSRSGLNRAVRIVGVGNPVGKGLSKAAKVVA